MSEYLEKAKEREMKKRMLTDRDKLDLAIILRKVNWPGDSLYNLDLDTYEQKYMSVLDVPKPFEFGRILAKFKDNDFHKKYVVVKWKNTNDICVLEYLESKGEQKPGIQFEDLKINKFYDFEINKKSKIDYRLECSTGRCFKDEEIKKEGWR